MKTLGYSRDYDEIDPGMRQLFDLTGRVALVTGGGSGLGRAIGLGFAHFGADVVVADIVKERAESVAQEIQALGRQAEAVTVDVRNWIDVESMVSRAQERFGHIDICLNSAGINVRKPILQMSPDEFRSIIDVNLTGSWQTAKAVGPIMVDRGHGKLINVASIYGHVAIEGNGAYAASKGGIVQLTKVLSLEWAQSNVQVNCLAPMYIKTALTEPIQGNEEFLQRVISRGPTPRFGEAWELIGPAVFLASDAAGLVTGHSLLVDGGWTAI